MPIDRYYTVTEEREVKICASTPIEAATLADKVFRDVAVISDQVPGRVLSPVRVRDIVAREDF